MISTQEIERMIVDYREAARRSIAEGVPVSEEKGLAGMILCELESEGIKLTETPHGIRWQRKPLGVEYMRQQGIVE